MYFEIQADNIARAVQFYQDLFGWTIEKTDENLPVEYWGIHGDQLAGGILQRPAPAPKSEQGTNAFTISFEVNDFDPAARQIIAAGGQSAIPKFAIPGRCWQGYFLDTEGNAFGLFEFDENAR
jgi:predicted enzyme related to lactoylglutathione lyase